MSWKNIYTGKERFDLKAPCFNCEERTSECHAICERYQQYAKENEKKRENKLQESINNGYYTIRRAKIRAARQLGERK